MYLGEHCERAQLSKEQILGGDLQRLPPLHYTNGLVLEIFNEIDKTQEARCGILYALAPDDYMLRNVNTNSLIKCIKRLNGKSRKVKKHTAAYESHYFGVFALSQSRPTVNDGDINEQLADHNSVDVASNDIEPLPMEESVDRNLVEVASTSNHQPLPMEDSVDHILGDVASTSNSNPPLPMDESVDVVRNAGNNKRSYRRPKSLRNAEKTKRSYCRPKKCDCEKNLNLATYQIGKKQGYLARLDQRIRKRKQEFGHYSTRNIHKRAKRSQVISEKLKDSEQKLTQHMSELKIKQSLETDLNVQIGEMQAIITELRNSMAEIEGRNRQLDEELKAQRLKNKQKTKKLGRLKKKLESHKDCVAQTEFDDIKKKLSESNNAAKYWENEADKLRDGFSVDLWQDNRYSIETRMLITELTGLEIAQSKISPVIEAVARNLFGVVKFPRLPDAKTVRNINDEGHYLAMKYIAWKVKESNQISIITDGTTKQKRKLLNTALYLSEGGAQTLSFEEVANETSETIAESVKNKLAELAIIDGSENYLPDILEKMTIYMSDRAANEKKKNRLLDEWSGKELTELGRDAKKVHHFFCMAHVLLGFHRNVVVEVNALQKVWEKDHGKFGRDKMSYPWRWESVILRVPRVASDIFGPVGDYLGMRDVWLQHCSQLGIKSKIGPYKDNRFNAMFETSAQLLHHLKDFNYLLQYKNSNLKLKSITEDLQDPTVITLVQAMAIIFIQISGPYWNAMESSTVPYVNLGPVIIQPLLSFIIDCETDPLPLYDQGPACLAPYKDSKSELFHPLLEPIFPENSELLDQCLQAACRGIAKTIKMQLPYFLEGGLYYEMADEETIRSTKYQPKTNIACEHHFGHLDSSQRRRPNCSMHHHTTIQLLKRNRLHIKKWYNNKSREEQKALWEEAKAKGKELHDKHSVEEKKQLQKLYDNQTNPKNKEKGAKKALKDSDMDLDDLDNSPIDSELVKLLPSDDLLAQISASQWIAVAWSDDWYPGVVKEVLPTNQLKVDFSYRTCVPKRFKSPNGHDMQNVDTKFVLWVGCIPIPVSGGRSWEFEQYDAIVHIFNLFKEVHF